MPLLSLGPPYKKVCEVGRQPFKWPLFNCPDDSCNTPAVLQNIIAFQLCTAFRVPHAVFGGGGTQHHSLSAAIAKNRVRNAFWGTQRRLSLEMAAFQHHM